MTDGQCTVHCTLEQMELGTCVCWEKIVEQMEQEELEEEADG